MIRPSIRERRLRVRPSAVSDDTVLPEPDSPITATVRPACTA
jgi:hypothetical protein